MAEDGMRVLFKGVSVFDRSQVVPIDGMPQALLEPPSEPLTGDSHTHLLEPMRVFAESLGFTVSLQRDPHLEKRTLRVVHAAATAGCSVVLPSGENYAQPVFSRSCGTLVTR
jgi:hypothetical protein